MPGRTSAGVEERKAWDPTPSLQRDFYLTRSPRTVLLWAKQENVCVLSFRRSPVADVMEDVRSKTFTLFFEVIDGWVLNHFHVDESIDSTQSSPIFSTSLCASIAGSLTPTTFSNRIGQLMASISGASVGPSLRTPTIARRPRQEHFTTS